MDDDLLLLELESNKAPILKPSLEDNFILLQTPVQKNLKVRFQTPARTPLSVIQPFNLQEEESWRERIEVVTKCDHEEYVNSAQVFIEEIIENVVARCNRCAASQSQRSPGIDNANNDSQILNKENLSPIDASFKSKKKSKKATDSPVDNALSAKSESSLGTVYTPNSTLRHGVDEQPSISEVYIEHCIITPQKKQSTLKTIYSIFDTNEIPPELKAEAEKAGQLCSKKNPVQSSQNCQKIGSGKKPQKTTAPDVYSTKKVVASRIPAPENVFSGPPAIDDASDAAKHFTSAEVYQIQSQATFEEEEFHDANALLEHGFEFDLNFLETKGYTQGTNDLRKQSLYLKFDPLVAGEAPEHTKGKLGRKSDIIDLNGHLGLPHFAEEPAKRKETIKTKTDLICASPETIAKTSAHMMKCRTQPSLDTTPSQESFKSVDGSSKGDIVELLKYTEADVGKIKEPLIKKINKLESEVSSQKQKIGQMQVVLQEFENTVMEMAEKYEEDKVKLEHEKEEITAQQAKTISHLESVEKAYLELLQRSEQMKVGIGNYKLNEETYKNVISEYQNAQQDANKRYEDLKTSVDDTKETDSFDRLTHEMAAERKEFRQQTSALKARCKCLENQAKSLQLQLDQKTTENAELTKICDELIEQQQHPSLASSRN